MASHPEFGARTDAETVAEAFHGSIAGKVILITGVSHNGLGETTTSALARYQPSMLILTGRSKAKVQEVIDNLQPKYPQVAFRFLQLDLSSQTSCRTAAKEIMDASEIKQIDIVICNAGVMHIQQRELSVDKIEMHFATNHVGHFLFVNLILPKVIAAARASARGTTRIVVLSSMGHLFCPVRFSDINFTKDQSDLPAEEQANLDLPKALGMSISSGYDPQISYSQSKTANVLFAVELNKRLFGKHGIKSFALHPGGIQTNLFRHMDKTHTSELVARAKVSGFAFKNLEQGSSTTLVAALDPNLSSTEGVYLADCQIAEAAAWAHNPDYADRLWNLSEELVKEHFSY